MKYCLFVVVALLIFDSRANSQEIDNEFVKRCLAGHAYWLNKLAIPRTYYGSVRRTKGKAVAEERVTIYSDLNRVCIESYSEANSERSRVVRVFAKKYYFTIREHESNQSFIIENVTKIQSTEDEQRASMFTSLYADQYVKSPILALDVPLKEVFDQQKWTITGIEKIPSAENLDEDYRVHARRVEDETYYDTLSFVVSPRVKFGVISYEVSHRKDAGNIVAKIFGSLEYVTHDGQNPELARVSIVESGFEGEVERKDLERISTCAFEVIENTCRKDVFTLPDYGIPDIDHLTTGQQGISKYWVLVSFLIALCFGCFWFYSRKR